MSERLKFRAWNGKQMISPDYITRDGSAYWKEDSIICYAKPEYVMRHILIDDMHNVEIYEGDIIETIYGDREEVTYYTFYTTLYSSDHSDMGGWSEKSINVIGNIHENPELLEGFKSRF